MQSGTRGTAAVTVALIGIAVFSAGVGCGGSTADETISREGALTEGLVDSFDDGDVSDWTDFADASSTVSHRISSSRAQTGTTSMKITYALAAGGYGGLEKWFSAPQDWSGTGSLTMWVYGLGTGHPFTVQLYDADGERWETTFTVDFTGWRQQVMPFAGFVQSGFQPPGVLANGVRDFAGVRGMALVVAQGGQAGAVYVDAIGTASGAVGAIVPLYIYPDSTSSNWDALFAAHAASPAVPIVAVLGAGVTDAGSQVDANYQRGVARLLAAGITVAGYVPTTYGARPLADVEANIDRWLALYPGTTAIFFDEQGKQVGQEAYYRELGAYAKSRGITMTIGNPGAGVPESFMGVLDTMMIYEGFGLPAAAQVGGWYAGYDRKSFGIIPYGCTEADLGFVATAKPTIGWIYLQSDAMPNPWDSLPPFLGQLIAALG
jgi:hypothetical protein